MTDRLNEVLTIAQVARRAGWCCETSREQRATTDGCGCEECVSGRRRMRRHLLTQDRQLGGMLLTKDPSGKRVRYLVTLQAIEQIHPEWFARAQGLGARLDEAGAELEDLRELVKLAHEEIGALKAKLSRLETRVPMRVA